MTGFAYLDEVAGDPGGVLAFAHRGGAYHPEIEGLENTMAAFQHAVALGYDYLETDVHVTRDGVLLAFHDAVLDRVTDVEGAIAELTFDEVRQALVGGREQVPTLAQLFDEFPRARFNIDLKSEGAVPALAEFIERARGLGPGAGRLVQPAAGSASSAGSPSTASRPPRTPIEVAVFRLRAQRPTGGLAHPQAGGRPADPAPPRALDDRQSRAGTPRARGRQARARLDRRRPRGDEGAPRPWRRRPVHRPDRPAQGRARPSAAIWRE